MSTRMISKVAATLAFLACAGCARDDSDPPDGRSGFSVFTDALTGCQYIGWAPGLLHGSAVTPRISADGKPVCKAVRP